MSLFLCIQVQSVRLVYQSVVFQEQPHPVIEVQRHVHSVHPPPVIIVGIGGCPFHGGPDMLHFSQNSVVLHQVQIGFAAAYIVRIDGTMSGIVIEIPVVCLCPLHCVFQVPWLLQHLYGRHVPQKIRRPLPGAVPRLRILRNPVIIDSLHPFFQIRY